MREDILRQVQQMYDESGTYWSLTRSKKYGKSANWPVIQKYLDRLKPGMTVLDVGCGNGRLLSGLPTGVKYLGFDFSRTLLAEAKKSFPDHEFRYGNMVEPSAWRGLGKYEAIFCIAVLHHLPDREQQVYALKQMKKCVKRGGFLCLSVWNLWQEKFLQSHLDSLKLKERNERWVEIPFAKKWKRFCVQMDIPYLVEIMTEAGWEIEEIYFADQEGEKSDIRNGQNLIVRAE